MSNSARKSKNSTLREYCCLNPEPESISDHNFKVDDFFDPHDLLQVKYEMLRKVKIDKIPVSKSASDFGFSRVSYYQVYKAFEAQGLVGLLAKKRGPKNRHKLGTEIMDFVNELKQKRRISPQEVAEEIDHAFHVTVHPRSIQRALAAQKKKRHD